MRVAGVFVGLSAQLDTNIRALGFGARDAERLHAAFSDSNEAHGAANRLLHLLVNEEATRGAVRVAIESVVETAVSGGCDVILVHFSCHGSPSGELVLYDTHRDDVAGTSLPLNWVSKLLSRVRSVDVVVTLDSCFSGTVLGLAESPNEVAFAQLMQDLSGEARAVVWAAGAQEVAYEAPALGHGYLSYGLLQTLDRSRSDSRPTLSTTAWLQGALDRAQELLQRDGYPQNPGAHLRTRAGASIPIPPLGPRQRRFAIQDGLHAVTAALSSLDVYGFTSHDLQAIERRLEPGAKLNRLQQEAISFGGVLAGTSVLVRAPTTAGKTLIGELAILRHWRQGRKAIILSPMRALVSEHAAVFREAYGPLGIRVVQSTGGHTDDDDLLLGNQFDVGFLTYEKFAAMLGLRPRLLDSVGVVVVDELQLIGDPKRGGGCELLLLRLRRRQRDGLPQLVALCGDVADLGAVDNWLNLRIVGPVPRPIPLREGVLTPDGVYRFVRSDSSSTEQTETLSLRVAPPASPRRDHELRTALALGLTEALLARGQRVLLFVTLQARALGLAEQLARVLSLPPHPELCTALEAIPSGDRHRTTKALLRAARGGVGVHTAALDSGERRAVEGAFREGSLRVLVATPTLAMGVNTPADSVVIVDTSFWLGPDRPPEPLNLLMCRNMAGRAGRVLPNGPVEGSAYLVAHSDPEGERLWDTYVVDRVYSLRSTLERLTPSDRFVALLGVLGEGGLQDVVDLSRQTLWGHQEVSGPNWPTQERQRFETVIPGLVEDGMVVQGATGSMRLSPVGQVASTLILEVESVRRVRRGVRAITEAGEPLDALALIVLAQVTVELEDVFVPGTTTFPPVATITAKGALFEGRRTTYNILVETSGIPDDEDPNRIVAARYRRLAGVRDWVQGRDLGDVEARYAGGDGPPALSHLRAAASRTEDTLIGVAAIVAAERPELADSLRSELPRLRARLEVGGNADAGRLFRLRLSLSRRQCLELVRVGIRNGEDLQTAIDERPGEVEQILSSPGFHTLRSQLERTRLRPSLSDAPDQLLLDVLQGGSAL